MAAPSAPKRPNALSRACDAGAMCSSTVSPEGGHVPETTRLSAVSLSVRTDEGAAWQTFHVKHLAGCYSVLLSKARRLRYFSALLNRCLICGSIFPAASMPVFAG